MDNDGFAEFTLHDADLDITGGDPDLTVTYHPTQSDADNNLNELADPYTNDSIRIPMLYLLELKVRLVRVIIRYF